jgi:hypothetical protein
MADPKWTTREYEQWLAATFRSLVKDIYPEDRLPEIWRRIRRHAMPVKYQASFIRENTGGPLVEIVVTLEDSTGDADEAIEEWVRQFGERNFPELRLNEFIELGGTQ